jgi:hypothetical protein
LSALRIRVPQGIKRTLTTMQITQFLIGITFATLHLFVYYSVPVATPFTKTVGNAVSIGASAVSSAASRAPEAAASAAAAALPSIGSYVKKALLRAAGEEGMAQKVSVPTGAAQLPSFVANATDASGANQQKPHTQWRTQYEYVPCIDTTGQAFAIWLNVFYLAPLTLLFVRFFVRSYSRRGAPNAKHSKPTSRISKAAEDAAKGTNRELDDFGKAAEDGVHDLANNVLNKFSKSTSTSTPKGGNKRATQLGGSKDQTTTGATPDRTASVSSKSSKTNDGSDNLTVGQIRKKASAEHNKLRQKFEDGPNTLDRLVSSPKTDTSSKTKHSGLERPRTPLSHQYAKYEEPLEGTAESLAKLEKDAEEKVTAVREAVGGQASRTAESVKGLAGDVKNKIEESMSESKFSDMGSFSLVDLKDLDASVADIGKQEKSGKEDDAQSLLHEIEEGSAPTFAEVANPDESTDSHESPASTSDKENSIPSFAAVANPEDPTHVSSTTESKPKLLPRSSSSQSEEGQRSQSPSKRSTKSKIPQPRNRPSTSPVKKILSPAKPTTSMAAHSGAAFVGKKDDTGTGKN